MRKRILAALLALGGVMGAAPAEGQEALERVAAMCADCHGAVDPGRFVALTHADTLTCLTCHHIGFTNDPGIAQARRVERCLSCHEDVRPAGAHAAAAEGAPDCTSCHSVHSGPEAFAERCATCHTTDHRLHADVGSDGPTCAQCHTEHTGRAFHAEDPAVTAACASCHESVHASHTRRGAELTCAVCHRVASSEPLGGASLAPDASCLTCHAEVRPAHADVEGETPGCSDCHGFAGDPTLPEAGPAVSRRCGVCHTEEMEAYWAGGHADGVAADPNPDLPTCVTCHAAHGEPVRGGTRVSATVECIACHSRRDLAEAYGLTPTIGQTFLEDFHGATVQFQRNQPGMDPGDSVLVCADCHGPHRVGWDEEAIVAEVCRRCHEAGDDYLAGAWLGHTPPGPDNEVLVWLVRVFYWFLIPFMLGGLFLQIAFHLVDQRRKGARVLETEGVRKILAWLRREKRARPETVVRFPISDRLEHLGSMITFILLVVTGLPQTRPDIGAANAIVAFFGGIAMTRLIHRIVGFAFVALMLLHVGRVVVRAIRRRRLPVMVPTWKDFEDVLQTFRHYFFRARRPKAEKFDFNQKFEYWGLFLGGIVMSGTGLILVFPELVTAFLPGEVVAAGRVMHGLEATFAVLVVVLWHSYGVILRPEIFPLDTTIFSGRMTVDRLRHEHRAEYERLFPDRAAAEPDEEEEAEGESSPLLRQGGEGLAGA